MLFLGIIILIAAALAVTGSFTFWPVTHGYDFYRPIVLFIGGFIVGIALIWIFIDLIGRICGSKEETDVKPKAICRFALHNGMACIRRLCLITCKVIHKEKMPVNKNYLLVCNHRSNFDNFLISEKLSMNKFLAFITKPSNTKIPLANRLLPQLGYLKIDREDPLQSLQVMKAASDKITNKLTSIAVFPEGTRSKDGNLGPFHEGVFNIAIKSQCPIVICTIKGTENVKKKFPLPTRTKLEVVGVLNFDEYEGMPAKQISETVRGIIEENLSR